MAEDAADEEDENSLDATLFVYQESPSLIGRVLIRESYLDRHIIIFR